MKTELQKMLNMLLEKYEISASAVLNDTATAVTVNGREYPLLPQRNERRFVELRKIVGNTVGNISHFKIMALHPKTTALSDLILRELDTAEWISGQPITEVFAVKDDTVATISCRAKGGSVFTLELSCNLPENAQIVDKHEIITDRGTACDRNVDSQTPLSSVYVYGKTPAEFTDVDFELFGLTPAEVATVRQAFSVAADPSVGNELENAAMHLSALLTAVQKSAAECVNVEL